VSRRKYHSNEQDESHAKTQSRKGKREIRKIRDSQIKHARLSTVAAHAVEAKKLDAKTQRRKEKMVDCTLKEITGEQAKAEELFAKPQRKEVTGLEGLELRAYVFGSDLLTQSSLSSLCVLASLREVLPPSAY
jgi:hypothetical protein